jgi:hypothetical protein
VRGGPAALVRLRCQHGEAVGPAGPTQVAPQVTHRLDDLETALRTLLKVKFSGTLTCPLCKAGNMTREPRCVAAARASVTSAADEELWLHAPLLHTNDHSRKKVKVQLVRLR